MISVPDLRYQNSFDCIQAKYPNFWIIVRSIQAVIKPKVRLSKTKKNIFIYRQISHKVLISFDNSIKYYN